MYISAKCKEDNKILYFYDLDSYNDYIDTYEKELIDMSIILDVPFGANIIDMSEDRKELRQAFNMVGLQMDKNIMQELYNNETEVDPNETIKQLRKASKHTFDIKDNTLEESDDNPQEISIRKDKLMNIELFKSFYTALEDSRKQLVRDTFKQYNLDIDLLDEYIDQEINMNIDIYLQEYDTESQFKQAEREYKKTDEYLKHKIFMKAIDKSYDVVRYADDQDDVNKVQGEKNTL